MPNPLVQFSEIVGRKTPRHPGVAGVKPEADTPESEEYYEGDNQAWRGTELHGVKSEHNSKAVEYGNRDAENAEVLTKYAPAPDPVDPIPVVVVNEYSREQRRFRAASFPVRDQAQQIVGAHERRTRVLIRNISQTLTPSSTLPPNNFLATMNNVVNNGNGSTVALPDSGWTDLLMTVTLSNVVLGGATNVIVKLQHTTDGVNWVDIPTSLLTFTAPGTQTAQITGPVSSRVRMAWTVTNGPATDIDGSGNVILFPINFNDVVTGNEVYIGSDASLSPITGYRLDPGQEITLSTETEVYAVCSTGETSLLNILDEYAVEIP